MQKFYTDKTKIFECNISVDGTSIKETKTRLLLQFPNNKTLLFHGKINESGKCEIVVPALKHIDECEGEAILEVIAESTYFESWRDKFELKTDKRVVVEVVESEKEIIQETITEPRVAVVIKEDVEEPKAKPVVKKQTAVISEEYRNFKKYLRENEINFNNFVKNKKAFVSLMLEYKKETFSSKEEISIIVENIKEEARLLKS